MMLTASGITSVLFLSQNNSYQNMFFCLLHLRLISVSWFWQDSEFVHTWEQQFMAPISQSSEYQLNRDIPKCSHLNNGVLCMITYPKITSVHHAFKRGLKEWKKIKKIDSTDWKKRLNSSILCQVQTLTDILAENKKELSGKLFFFYNIASLDPFFMVGMSILPYNLCLGCIKLWGNNIRQGCDCPNNQGAFKFMCTGLCQRGVKYRTERTTLRSTN